jgi:hypothetical protein
MPDRLTTEDLEKSHHGLCGVFIGDGPCSCLVHWVKALQEEADKLKLERLGFQLMARRMVDIVASGVLTADLEAGRYERGSGEVECSECCLLLREHPQIPKMPTFHITCLGKIVKT